MIFVTSSNESPPPSHKAMPLDQSMFGWRHRLKRVATPLHTRSGRASGVHHWTGHKLKRVPTSIHTRPSHVRICISSASQAQTSDHRCHAEYCDFTQNSAWHRKNGCLSSTVLTSLKLISPPSLFIPSTRFRMCLC